MIGSLSLSSNEIGDEGAVAVAEALRMNNILGDIRWVLLCLPTDFSVSHKLSGLAWVII